MSSQHRLAPVAEAGRLHRDALERAADLVHDERGERLALDVLGDDRAAARPRCATCSRSGSRSFITPIFRSVSRMSGVLEHRLHLLRVGDEVRARGSRGRTAAPRPPRAAVSVLLASSTVITPSSPTFSIASATSSPMRRVVVGGDGGDLRLLEPALHRPRQQLAAPPPPRGRRGRARASDRPRSRRPPRCARRRRRSRGRGSSTCWCRRRPRRRCARRPGGSSGPRGSPPGPSAPSPWRW